MAHPTENQGTAPAQGSRRPMSRSEAARHASLVRWGKEQPFAARLQAIREKRKKAKGKGKGKAPKADPAAEKEKKQNEARALVKQAMMDGDVGLAPKAFDNLMGLGKGEEPDEMGADGLIKMGMAERGGDGTLRLTSAGRAVISASNRGDAKAAIDAVSRGVDRATTAQNKEASDKEAAAEKEKAAKPAGGGGGGKKEKTKEEKQQEQQAEREKTAAATAPKAGISAADVEVLRTAANEGGATSEALLALGLIDEGGNATDQGRRALSALERGNVASYRAAVQDAEARLGREKAKVERGKETEAANEERAAQDEERTAAASAREAARAARRERLQNIALRRLDSGGKLSDSARVDLEEAGLIDADGQLTEEGKKRIAKKEVVTGVGKYKDTKAMDFKSIDLEQKIQRIRSAWYEANPLPKAMEIAPPTPEQMNVVWLSTVLDDGVVVERKGCMYRVPFTVQDGKIVFASESEWEPVQHGWVAVKTLEQLADTLADSADSSIKAGARHSASDTVLLQQIYDAAEDICGLAEALGAASSEEEEETQEGGEVELKTETLVLSVYGSEIKALGDSSIGGYAVLFGSSDTPDMSAQRDYFTKSTDFWLDKFGWPKPMTYHHGLDPDTADDPIVGTWTKAVVKDEGVWLEGQLNTAHRYHGAIKELIKRGYLKLSSDSAPQWVKRERQANGTNEVKRWPLISASPTVTPAEPRLSALAFKSLLAEIGYEDIQDSPEATPDVASDRQDAVKAQSERARRLSIELSILALETAQ